MDEEGEGAAAAIRTPFPPFFAISRLRARQIVRNGFSVDGKAFLLTYGEGTDEPPISLPLGRDFPVGGSSGGPVRWWCRGGPASISPHNNEASLLPCLAHVKRRRSPKEEGGKHSFHFGSEEEEEEEVVGRCDVEACEDAACRWRGEGAATAVGCCPQPPRCYRKGLTATLLSPGRGV